jgi:hypothetical protein
MGKLVAVSLLAVAGLAQDAPHTAGWVVIPVQEYVALRGKAMPPPVEPAGAPVDATLSRVDYELRVDRGVASGHANLTVDVLKDGWVKVPIPAGLLVREARAGGKSVSLVNGAAVLSARGRSVLTLNIAMPVNATGGEERLALPPSGSGVTRASLAVGRPDVEVKVAGGILSAQEEGAWLAYGRGNEPLVFSWRRKDPAVPKAPASKPALRMRGSLVELVGLGEDGSSITAEVSLEVLQGEAERARILVPEGVTVNQVPGATVVDWDVKNGELLVTFLEPVDRAAKFIVQGEMKLPRDGALDIPLLRLQDVERETGGVAVEVLGAGEIRDRKPQGLETADASELGATVAARQSPSLAAFRLRQGAPARSLSLTVARYTQQAMLTAIVDEARYRVLLSRDGKTLVQATYAVRNNQRSFVKIALPPDAVLWSASEAGRAVRPGKSEDGGLLFPLEKARAGDEAPVFAIEVLYLARDEMWTDRGHVSLALPSMDMPVSKTGVVLYYPPMYRATVEPGTFRAQEYVASQWSGSPGPLFPAVGPSVYLVSELTAENVAPKAEVSYVKNRGQGSGVKGRNNAGGEK